MTATKEYISKDIYFETIRCEDEEVFYLEFHKSRIARTIGLNIELQEYIYPPSKELLKCKVIYDNSGILDISYSPYKKRQIKTLNLICDNSIEYKYKSTFRDEIDKLYILKDNCDDIVIVKNGFITDTSIANIAVCIDDIWYTPTKPLLLGTTRERLIKDGFLKERNLTVKEYQNSSKIALMNAMIGFDILVSH